MMIKKIIISFVFLFVIFSSVFATRYYVKPDGDDNNNGTSWLTAVKTLMKVVTITLSGDEVWVATGTYQEGYVIIIPKGVSLYGGFKGTENNIDERDIENNQTIIDGNYSYRCVTNNGIISGFYLINGNNGLVGGILNVDKYCIISDCVVYNNWGYSYGGIFNTLGTVTNSKICYNVSNQTGGIENLGGNVVNCEIYNNGTGYISGGISNTGTVSQCKIYNNEGDYYSGGIFNNPGGIVINCIVYNNHNSNAEKGGGIFNRNLVVNTTVYNNSITGILNDFPYYPPVINCISWGNESQDIVNNDTVSYSCFGEAVDGVNNNIKTEPLFVNTYGDVNDWDFHLQSNSPCIDAGCYREDATSDFEGNLRGYDGSPELRGDGSNFDMGAYEYVPKKYVDDDNTSGPWYGTLEHPFMKVQDGIDATIDGDFVIVFEGNYQENVRFKGKNITVQSNNLADSSIVSNTIIDGNHWGSAVTFNGSESANCILSGFTIKNGFAIAGGGICGNGTQATIQYNHITENMCYVNIPYGDFGAGVFGCDGLIESNVIDNNFANYAGGGLAYCGGRIWNNIISGNSASEGGGFAFCDGDIQNNTIYGNTATYNGGGFYDCKGVIQNCIIWENGVPDDAQLFDCATPTYSCIQNWLGNGLGNITDEPILVNPLKGNFHLQVTSHCIDAGCFVLGLTKDFEGDLRGFNGSPDIRGDGSDFDIGADEFIPLTTNVVNWIYW